MKVDLVRRLYTQDVLLCCTNAVNLLTSLVFNTPQSILVAGWDKVYVCSGVFVYLDLDFVV